jgi:hypothetical protein
MRVQHITIDYRLSLPCHCSIFVFATINVERRRVIDSTRRALLLFFFFFVLIVALETGLPRVEAKVPLLHLPAAHSRPLSRQTFSQVAMPDCRAIGQRVDAQRPQQRQKGLLLFFVTIFFLRCLSTIYLFCTTL